MNPGNTTSLRPRDRHAGGASSRISPKPSPCSSPRSSRRSESLPATKCDETAEKCQPSMLKVPEIPNVDSQSEKKESINRERPRSGSWGGANESEDEIKVIRNLDSKYVNMEGTTRLDEGGDNTRILYKGLPDDTVAKTMPSHSQKQHQHSNNCGTTDETLAAASDTMKEFEEKLRRRLAFYFMDPIQKFIARRQAPWKLMLQFLKVLLVTTQLIVFGYYRYAHTNYYGDNKIGFEHLFLGDRWDPVREIDTYPPATGVLAFYKKSSFYSIFNSTAETFHNLENVTVNPIFKNSSFGFCIESFKGGGKVKKDLKIPDEMDMQSTETKCIKIEDGVLDGFNSERYLEQNNFTIPWDTMHRMRFNFSVTTVTYRRLGTVIGPECFRFAIVMVFDNSDHDGQIPISLKTNPERLLCPTHETPEHTIESTSVRILNLTVILVCLMSLILCCRALARAQILCAETNRFFKIRFMSHLTLSERWQFLNLWYVLICINDLLLITGSVITEMLESRKTTGDLWDFCSIFLGTGNLLVWIGMLRYLGFFEAYNALILTIKGALPNVARFVICAGFVYAGYSFCGWIVFAPYHFKFRTLGSTSECLFSLVNGDDMFATFSMIPEKLGVLHGFSRIYLYSFVMLFIYVILSLFIAIIMDTYENIKYYHREGFPRSHVDEFYLAKTYDPYSDVFFDGSKPSCLYTCWAGLMLSFYGQHWAGFHRHSIVQSRQNCSQNNRRTYSVNLGQDEQQDSSTEGHNYVRNNGREVNSERQNVLDINVNQCDQIGNGETGNRGSREQLIRI